MNGMSAPDLAERVFAVIEQAPLMSGDEWAQVALPLMMEANGVLHRDSDAVYALEELLRVAERMRGGDPSLDPEEWYAARDYARATLKKIGRETP